MQSAGIGAFTSMAFYGVGEYFANLGGIQGAVAEGWNVGALEEVFGTSFQGFGLTAGQTVAKIAVHGLVGGVMSVVSGGKFGHGFASAGLTQAASGPIGRIGSNPVRAVAAGIIGGTASEITGGKFANGATTAAFASLFSELARGTQEKEPPGRGLTKDEITEAQKVFGDKIDYSQVRIIDGKFVPWQGDGYVIAPDGNIYWPGECGNLATCGGPGTAGVFIHEMTHVLQVQHDVNVLGRGLLLQAGKFLSGGLYDPYEFTYDAGRSFSSYNIEQQGDYAREIYFGRLPNKIDY